jgi:hypothetical protein
MRQAMVAKLLLQHGADATANHSEAIREAFMHGDQEMKDVFSKYTAAGIVHLPLVISDQQAYDGHEE